MGLNVKNMCKTLVCGIEKELHLKIGKPKESLMFIS